MSLDLHTKQVIRAYMLKLIAVPVGILTIISALVGYIVREHEDSAVVERAWPVITETAKQVGIANGEVSSSAKQTSDILASAKSKSEQIDNLLQEVQDTLKKRNDEAKANFATFAHDLLIDPKFRDALGTEYQSDLSGLKEGLEKWGETTTPTVERSGANVSYKCLEGSYITSIVSTGNTAPPFCIGCLNNLQVTCRSLRLK